VIPFGPRMVAFVQRWMADGGSIAVGAKELNVSHGVIRACVAMATEPGARLRARSEDRRVAEVVELAA
jgi:hypothetical protein